MKFLRSFSLPFVLFCCLSIAGLTGLGCRQAPPLSRGGSDTRLEVWGLWQSSSTMNSVIEAFAQETGIQVDYQKLASVADYERMLLEAFALNREPDAFVIHHTWVENKRHFMTPAPPDVISMRQLLDEFVDVVAFDVVRDNGIYALPFSVDTLALYYNRDMLSAAGAVRPPRTWEEVQRLTESLTRIGRTGDIEQSAIAFGTGANINRAGDIVQVLMMQSGMPLSDPNSGRASLFDEGGTRSLTFYTDFANKTKTVYTWNLQQDYSLDAFAASKTAMMVNYSYHAATIRAKSPRLAFATAPLPQIPDSKIVNFASYWPFAVSINSDHQNEAWQFVRFMTRPDMAERINQAEALPPAHRESIDKLRGDPFLGVFAEQALTAASWRRPDIAATDAIFHDMIDSVVLGTAAVSEALTTAEGKLNQLRSSQ
jgi:ABC-type glycerol-3-phosphate transport system substrate-binding protein